MSSMAPSPFALAMEKLPCLKDSLRRRLAEPSVQTATGMEAKADEVLASSYLPTASPMVPCSLGDRSTTAAALDVRISTLCQACLPRARIGLDMVVQVDAQALRQRLLSLMVLEILKAELKSPQVHLFSTRRPCCLSSYIYICGRCSL